MSNEHEWNHLFKSVRFAGLEFGKEKKPLEKFHDFVRRKTREKTRELIADDESF